MVWLGGCRGDSGVPARTVVRVDAFESWSLNLDPTDINKNHGTFCVDNSSLDSSFFSSAHEKLFWGNVSFCSPKFDSLPK